MKSRFLLPILLFALSTVAAWAQPANDLFANATTITANSTASSTTVNATKETGEPAPYTGLAHSVWYKFTAPISATYTVSISGSFRETIAVCTGTAVNALTILRQASAGNFGGTTASLTFPGTAGTVYSIQVDGRAGASGTFNLSITTPPPIVTLNGPIPLSYHRAGTNLVLSANATAQQGTILGVFFATNSAFSFQSPSSSSPYTYTLSNTPASTPGFYSIVAAAVDSLGAVGFSSATNITVLASNELAIVRHADVWKYLDDGSDQGTAWQSLGYNDSFWGSGPSQLGYGDGDEATTLLFGPDSNNKYPNYYFRREFVVTNATQITNVYCRVLRDDGVIVYLNTNEIQRNNMPAGAVTSTTFAAANAGDDGALWFPTNINRSFLLPGTNVLAAEIHQDNASSSDISFDFDLIVALSGNNVPSVAITNPVDAQRFTPGTNITISAIASDSDGTVTNVAFYADSTLLKNVTAPPYTITWSNVAQGNYTLTAVATDDSGQNNTSAGVDISVNTFFIVPVTLVPTGSVWKYLDNGSDQGTAWQSFAFDDTLWPSGPAQLGYSQGQENDEATLLGYGPDVNNKWTNYYFRKLFTVTNAAAVSNLTIRLIRDDGAVVYINGVEVRRDNMPEPPNLITSTTLALAAIGGTDESTYFPTTTNAVLNNGTNVIAVEMHQNIGTSSDISFDLELIATTIQGAQITNVIAPFVQSQNPSGGSSVAALTSVTVTFSEAVTGVNASDLLVAGSPATGVTGNGNVYTFTFPQPGFGLVNITWAGAHGIVDQGTPQLPFDGAASSNIWSYTLVDNVAPTIVSRTPAAGASLTNLNSVNVVWSEDVQGVNASDMLVNGSPATGLTVNNASNYTFSFAQPAAGTINITWTGAHGISDTSPSANAFNGNGIGSTWSYTLSIPPTILVSSNSLWRFAKGTNDAALSPGTAWRQVIFDETGWISPWSDSPTPFYYGDPYTNNTTGVGTLLSDMTGVYQCVLLRHTFVLDSPASVTNFIYRHQSDDGFVAWINGTEVLRYDMGGAPVDPPYVLASGVQNAPEPANNGSPYIFVTNSVGLSSLVPGTNIITVQAFNTGLSGSSDFGFNLQFEATILNVDPTNLPPRVLAANPSSGDLFYFTNLTVTFSERVSNVDASDLLINGVAASSVSGAGQSNFTFTFAQPAYGIVNVTWAGSHGIVDFDAPPKSFDGTAPGATFTYNLINPNAPVVFSRNPAAGGTVSNLTQVNVVFSKSVVGVNAADLLVNGAAATSISGSGSNYTFSFTQPAYGNVTISWSVSHGISDGAGNNFDPARPGNTWQYILIDRTAPTIVSKNPPAGSNVTNLTSATVTFSETVSGVNASDLLINGIAATNVTGNGLTYTFSFVQPNQSVVNFTWALTHGILDTAGNAFDSAGVGATWQYFTPDNVPPTMASVFPPISATIRELTQVAVTFTEPVTGVNAQDLLINNIPATGLSGSAAGPYTFTFTQPATGAVEIAWAFGHGITDLASPGNAFVGADWNYVLNPNAVFAGKIVINEIMFQPPTINTNDEWIELRNLDTTPINLNGWRFTKGVSFTFPNVSIAAGGYLVIAANLDAFQTRHPSVANVVGGWAGTLGNNGESIRLVTALGETVDEVSYATEGVWALRYHALAPMANGSTPTDYGWFWRCDADGRGKSFELMNPAMPHDSGYNWRSSTPTNGTPGVVNSVASTNIAPVISDVIHLPIVPRSSDTVTISARIIDEQPGVVARVFYRNYSTLTPTAFAAVQIFDDGLHNDGAAGDGIYAGTIPPQANDTVIDYYVQAVDIGLRTNSFPAPALSETNLVGQFANALYQVDDRTNTYAQPVYKIIMTEPERQQRAAIAQSRSQSDAEMDATFISIDGTGVDVRYNCGIRERGAGSRGYVPPNHRVNIPNDRPWRDQTEMNLNSRYTHPQFAGYVFSFLSGLDSEPARVIRLRVNNADPANSGLPQYGCYVHLQGPGAELATTLHPTDDGGNVYRTTATRAARLDYRSNFATYSNDWDKVSNQSENNWSDLIALTFALSANTPDSNYVAAVRAKANVEEWMRFFAVAALLNTKETSLANAPDGSGDDYTLYFAPKEGRAYLVFHDWDTILNQGDTGGTVNEPIFRSDAVAAVNRFMHFPEFQQLYYDTLRQLCATSFEPTRARRTLEDHLGGGYVPANIINDMANFLSNRVNYVLSIIPRDTNAPGVLPNTIGGTLTTNTIMRASDGPFTVTTTLTIANGATLTIEPGATVRFNAGVGLTVANGGRLIADGTAALPILFTRNGASGNWGNITINGTVGSPESRVSYAQIEFNSSSAAAIQVSAGTAVMDHLTFGNNATAYIHVDGASFVISHCVFPSCAPGAAFELVHGTGGVKAGGRGIFYRNWFGVPRDYNDVVDFTGGNRPSQPIVHFIENVFTGASDDILDLDGTDAWIEGNIFMHAHRNGSPDSASAISGGNDPASDTNPNNTSDITIVGNIIYDCDMVANAKQWNFYSMINNTIVRITKQGGTNTESAVALMSDVGTAEGAGMYLEGNVIYDVESLLAGRTVAVVTYTNNIIYGNLGPAWTTGSGLLGGNNSTNNPLFKFVPLVTQTSNFTTWASAQIMREWFSLQINSPGIATGPGGTDKGFGANGAKITATFGVTTNDAVLRVHFNRSGSGIPTSGFPNGSGFTHYKWRLDGGPWSAETPVATTVTIPGFYSGNHRFDVSGKLDSGLYQDNADFGELALPTSFYSKPTASIRLNEVLASNQSAVNHENTAPDVIELYNPSSFAVDISGLRLTDDQTEPNKFFFPSGTTISAGGYLVVYANDQDGTTGIHIGFNLSKAGQSLYLYDKVDNGGGIIDSVTFGLQVTDLSIGRYGTNWSLCLPTFGSANLPAAVGNPTNLYINEILASEVATFSDDFVEIANPLIYPIDLSGLFITDNPPNWPDRSTIPPLTFIEANSYLAFRADGKTDNGADHLSFSLAAERGMVALLNKDYSIIDQFLYESQTTDISQGRVSGSMSQSNTFTVPTPGAANPGFVITNTGVAINEVLAANATITESDGSTPDWIELFNRSTNAVDLSGVRLTDDVGNLNKFVFPPGLVIAGRGYLRFTCDGGALASATNTGFNIKAESGFLYLIDKAPANTVLDVMQYGLQATDFSVSRLPDGTGAWGISLPTPSGPNIPATLASPLTVKVNEWMPAPNSGEDWFELYNPNPQPVSLGGFYLSDDSSVSGRIKYPPIPPLSFLGSSTNGYQRFWADSNPASGANHTSFKLNNTTEWIVLTTPSNTVVDQVGYTNVPAGVSEGRFPDGAAIVLRFAGTDSPNEANYLLLTNVVINEALTHTDLPLEDAIELRNLRSTNVNIGNWWLSDAKGNLRKYRFPANTIVPANGYLIVYEYQFNDTNNFTQTPFALSSHGDEIYLSTGDINGNSTGYRTSVKFEAAFNGVSFGRYVTSNTNEEFVAMSQRSFGPNDPSTVAQFRTNTGAANPYPVVGPIVIAKIMYHPPDINGTNDDTLSEFIELKNMSASTQPLYDSLFPTNTWRLRDAVDYDFPQGVSLPAGGSLLVVSFDPVNNPVQLATFRAKYSVDAGMPVYGPYTGKLANDNDKIELRRPDAPDLGEVPYVLVERVHYFDLLPWSPAADGTGAGLQRVSLTGYGNDPTNWIAAIPSFGADIDTDRDGMPDSWEIRYGLNRLDPSDALQDTDGDGLNNQQEYLAGTEPNSSDVNNPYSSLRIRNVENLGANNARLTFVAMSNHTYTVQFKDGLNDPSWSRLTDVSAVSSNRTMQIYTVVPSTNRFFRVRTPQAP